MPRGALFAYNATPASGSTALTQIFSGEGNSGSGLILAALAARKAAYQPAGFTSLVFQ